MQSATRLITNCDGTCTWSTLKLWSTFQTISISSYRPLTNLTSYTRKLICILTFFEPSYTFCLFSNLHKFLLSKVLQEFKYSILPIVYAARGANSVLWGTKIIASYVSILTNFYRKWTETGRKSSSSEAEPAITCNRKFYPKYLNEHEEE